MAAYHYQQGDRPLDGYTIQYAIGRGGFGEVYFAVSDSGREVALKAVQNFEDVELRGIGHCMNLKSPHLVMIFDVRYAANGMPWVIMEYVSGPSLRDILDESPDGLSPEQAQFFLRELAKGLSYLHDAGVVHRDLKPHNVFFEDGLVKIGDYSLSKVITTSHRSGNTMTVGSVHYMAPEISLGRYDRTVDIYALGVMLHEMLTGEPPYTGESMGEVLMKHLSSDPDVSQLPEPFAGVIAKAMRRDPADRYQSAGEMVRAISGDAAPPPIEDSFHPATLSLVGERAQQAKAQRATSAAQAAAITPAVPPVTTSTASAVVDTSQNGGTGLEAKSGRRGLLNRMALHYSPARHVHAIPDHLAWPIRLLLSAVVTLILVMMAAMSNPFEPYSYTELAVIAIGTTAVCAATVMIGLRWLVFDESWWSAVTARVCWLLVAGLLALFLLRAADDPWIERLFPAMLAMLAALTIPDWRCFIAFDRLERIAPVPTLAIGAVAAVFGARLELHGNEYLKSAALAMAGAMCLQLLAPLRKQAEDAPVRPAMTRPKQPRLLYDGPAILLELLVVLCVGIFLMVAANSPHPDFIFVVGIVSFLTGGMALRFRLQRRAWPEEPGRQGPGKQQPSTVARGQIRFSQLNVLLELLILASAFVLMAVLIDGDDRYVMVGALALLVGVPALRWRLHRHRVPTPSTPHDRSRFRLDPLSIFLELLVGVCAVAAVVVLLDGNGMQVRVFGTMAVIIGVLALRYRLARREVVADRSGDRSPGPSGNGSSRQSEESQEIHS